MTHLIIHNNTGVQREYLLKEINRHLKREFTQIAQLHNVPDLHILELPENTSIGIELIKNFQKEMIFQPFEELYQVGVIFHAQNLTVEAQNALLKTLEEDSERTLYFILVDNERKLLPTILSRSVRHFVTTADSSNKEAEIKYEKPEILELSLSDQLQAVEKIIDQEKEDKVAVREFLNELVNYYRQELLSENDADSRLLINENLKVLTQAQQRINANVNKRLALENVFLKLK